jgi:hypothetical protein
MADTPGPFDAGDAFPLGGEAGPVAGGAAALAPKLLGKIGDIGALLRVSPRCGQMCRPTQTHGESSKLCWPACFNEISMP